MTKHSNFKPGREDPPEEHGRERGPGRRGGKNLYDGGGFPEGTHGRGPTPYMAHEHSGKMKDGHKLSAHVATAGRGGGGLYRRTTRNVGVRSLQP